MAASRFRLLAGIHVQQEPDGTTNTYTAGQVVVSNGDLVEKFGAMKFERLGDSRQYLQSGTGNFTAGDPPPELVIKSPATAPHGQVSTGFQGTTGSGVAASGVNSGGVSEEDARDILHQDDKGYTKPNVEAAGTSTAAPTNFPSQSSKTQVGQGSSAGHPPPTNEKEYHAALERMSVKELQAHAAEEEVELSGSTRKEDIIKRLKAAR